MSDTEEAEGTQDLEAPDEELEDEEDPLLHFSKYIEARRGLPWEQWTFREKANFYIDRIFLGVLFIFLLVLMGECCYKMWYVTNMKKIVASVSDIVVFLFNWLSAQEKQEELFEL